MKPHKLVPRVVLSLLTLLSLSTALRADTETAAKLLPPSTIAFVELQGVEGLVDMVLGHPLRDEIESLDEVKQAYRSKEYLEFRAVITLIEAKLGKPWREAVEELTDGGAYAAFDAETEGVVLLIQAANKEAPKKTLETFVELARADAKGKGKPDPVKQAEYRELTAYGVDEAKFVALDDWLMITNKGDLAKAIVDAKLDGDGKSLASNERFQQAWKTRPKSAQLWGFVDIKPIRESGVAEAAYREQTDNPGIELLVGGLIPTLRKTPFATFAIELQSNRLAASVGAPHDPTWTPEKREFYFGPQGKGRAPSPIRLENTLLTLSTYRDFGEMWMRAGDLFDENVNDEIAKAESNLSTLFSGKEFGEDILGELKPEMQLIVVEQNFEGVLPQPSIKLPSFAIVAHLKEPEKMRNELRRTFQSLIGFLNVVGAMQGQPQLDLDMEKEDGKLIVSSSYAPEDDEKESKDARINFNFSPSVAFRDDVFILSSTTELARKLADKVGEQMEPSKDNTRLQANISALRSVLVANREHLIAQNMLEDGNSREEAEKQIDVLMSILSVFKDATLRLTPTDESINLNFEVQLSDELK